MILSPRKLIVSPGPEFVQECLLCRAVHPVALMKPNVTWEWPEKKKSSMGQFDGCNLTVGSTSCLQQSTRKSLNIQ